jgi:hypothetical protein
MEWWQQFWIKGIDVQFGLKMGEVLQSRRWLLDIISSIINVRQPNGESKTSQSDANQSVETSSEIVEIWAKPLRLLITSSLFVVPEKLSKKCKIHELKQILELAEIEDEQLADINNQIQNIINVNRNAYLKYAFEFAKEWAVQKGVQLRNPFEDVAQDVWNRLLNLDFSNHQYKKILEPLLSQCGFNMMIDSANGAVLNDILNLIEDRKIDDDWMPALVELLISFFTDDSQKTRSLVLSCFKQINQDLNRKSIEVIAGAIDPAKDASLEVEDDDVEDGEDSDEENGDGENGDEKMDDDSDEDDESEDDSEDEGIDTAADNDADMEELKRKLAAAMGEKDPTDDREEESDEDEDDDFTDEQMFAMDNAISGAFKSMGKGKKKADQKIELQKRNFKLRVLDLVEIFMKRNSKSPHQFLFVKPLLKCARAKTESPLSQKAGKMVSKVMPSEKVRILSLPLVTQLFMNLF